MTSWPFGSLLPASYRLVVADPPWAFKVYSPKGLGKSAERHYQTMPLPAIKALPVADLAHPEGCGLVMWCTWPFLEHGIDTLRAWGFRYSSGLPWAKQSRSGKSWAFGPGYTFRNASEFVLYGVRGRVRVASRSERGLIVAPVREHSRKPDESYRKWEALFPGPRADLFSRATRPGWDAWGLEVGKFDERTHHAGGASTAA